LQKNAALFNRGFADAHFGHQQNEFVSALLTQISWTNHLQIIIDKELLERKMKRKTKCKNKANSCIRQGCRNF